jgi:hypothetical protein
MEEETGCKFKEETREFLHFENSFYGAEALRLRKVDHKYLQSSKMCC